LQPKSLHLVFLKLSVIFFLFSGILFWRHYFDPNRLNFTRFSPPVKIASVNPFFPENITIPDLNISLPVIPAKIQNGKWPTTGEGVSYLSDSQRPGEIGNSIFYGHNWPRLLGNLSKIKPGQKIILGSKTATKIYYVTETKIVTPQDISILADTSIPRLTIYTCYGFADSKRFVAIASPLSSQ